ncbi:exonuclease RecJ [Haladaptatus caseinilyticus]|uniref:exonuclease RecJ n=1 Tax=Haladaptatus caseinilyticus TaxID=2993314 RepID=UPI00224BA086|nr:exonuclease RecJ [Haladaptatus caseinilyticus]
MATSGRTASEDAPTASDVTATLRDAGFVRIVAYPDGDGLAASGVLARTCANIGIPFQVSATRFPTQRADSHGDDVVVTVGAPGGTVALTERPASIVAFEAADGLGGGPDPVLALAGAVAAGTPPGADDCAHLLDAASDRLTRRPGVATPTEDLADGLAHSTLIHTGFSGNPGAVQAELAEIDLPVELDDDAHRRVASLVALSVTGPESATPRAGKMVERVLHPYELVDGPFATLGGYADVLDAVAHEQSGTGIALALGHDARAPALDAWRDHAESAHAVLQEATTGRYDGLFVARTDGAPVETAARLLGDYRSPEPIALVVTDDEAAAVAVDGRGGEPDSASPTLGDAMATAADGLGGAGTGSTHRGYARFDADAKEFLSAFREAL